QLKDTPYRRRDTCETDDERYDDLSPKKRHAVFVSGRASLENELPCPQASRGQEQTQQARSGKHAHKNEVTWSHPSSLQTSL
ncbi:MAG TPA: hypothetical protein VFO18_04800, partial [Methylomirabilota bacterium]|nr:hypothetical protein [Methylomirabilota bacterium]